MRTTPFVVSIHNSERKLQKAIELLVSYSDSAAFVSAGIQLGRIQEIASGIVDTCQLAQDAVWEDNYENSVNKKSPV